MAHDPKAPRLAAVATLLSAGLLIFTAINLNLTLIGTSGLGNEEYAMLALVVVFLLVRFWASRELVIPEFTPRSIQANQDFTPVSFRASHQENVNPTTQSIITGILGQSETAVPDVNSAMATLGVGPAPTQQAVEPPATADHRPDQGLMDYSTQVRQALPTDPNDGRSLQRTVNQPVPLPGQRAEDLVDPTTIPGLESRGEFITEGTGVVPLPTAITTTQPTELLKAPAEPSSVSEHNGSASPPPLDLPSIDDLFVEPDDPPVATPPSPATLDLPSIDDLFPTQSAEMEPNKAGVPTLPNLDDLF